MTGFNATIQDLESALNMGETKQVDTQIHEKDGEIRFDLLKSQTIELHIPPADAKIPPGTTLHEARKEYAPLATGLEDLLQSSDAVQHIGQFQFRGVRNGREVYFAPLS